MTAISPTSAALTAVWADASAAAAEAEAWQDLAAGALEPNPFYAPGAALAALRHLPEGARTRMLMIWRATAEGRELAGLLPVAAQPRRYLVPLPLAKAADFQLTLTAPLIAQRDAEAVWTAILDALAASGRRALLIPFISDAGPVFAALRAACARSGRDLRIATRHERALLSGCGPGDAYLRATLESRRRKEADRQRRRLAELGELTFTVARSPAEVEPAMERFLDLEARGWKGAAGTALRLAPGGLGFGRDLARSMATRGDIRIAALELSGRPVAMGLVLTSRRRAFYIKTAYDEALARYSPGLLLTLDLTRHLLDDGDIDDADSIAVSDHPMIDRVWTDRLPMASVVVACSPGDALARLAAGLEGFREQIRIRTAGIRKKLR